MRLKRVRSGRWEVLAVCTDRGDCPILEALDGIAPNLLKDAQRMLALFDHVSRDGPPRNTEISCPLGNGIYEFRRGPLRTLWFYGAGRIVVCSHMFVKKTNKTPKKEIHRAAAWRKRYTEASERGELELEE